MSETRIHLDICDLVEGGGKVLHHVGAERLDVLDLDELEHLQRGEKSRHAKETVQLPREWPSSGDCNDRSLR